MAKQIQDDNKFTGIRLPTTIKPIHYDIRLEPDLENFTFQGEVQIEYQSSDVIGKCIVLHSNELVIGTGSIKNDSCSIILETVYYSNGSETATLEFGDNIPRSGSISLQFSGKLNDKLRGFYRTSFKIGDSTVHAATTHFEPTEARRCFPCWDEPNIKATFTVTLITRKFIEANGQKYECVALSNMNEVSRSDVDQKVEVKFAKTPVMSTYLMAFIVGPFEAIEGGDVHRPVRVFTTPGKKDLGKYALDVACKSLHFYEDYFLLKECLPKMDLIAIPDFPIGAMENWGLVTYRETCLLVDPTNTSTSVKQYAAIVVAHELAHQWFGNLVTMEWWTHLWLKEGFATFMSFLAIDHIFPGYDIWSDFVTNSYSHALDLDSLNSSHPIEVPVKHPSEIGAIFDAISYEKGASVLRMLHNYIGDDSFRKGMNSYLTKFAFKNTATEDLWDSLEAASNKPVRKLMSGWTLQKGYPWLSVKCNDSGDKMKLSVSQNKFNAGGLVPAGEADITWMVPIMAVSGDRPSEIKQLGLLESRHIDLEIQGANDSWIKLNPGAYGLYRCAYPDVLFKRLQAAISDQSLAPIDRLAIQGDYFALSMAGKVDTVQLLELLKAYKHETDYAVWNSIDCCLSRLNSLLLGTDSIDSFHRFSCQLYRTIYNRMGWSAKPDEKHTDALTRALVINRLVTFGDQNVIDEAKKRFSAHVAGADVIPADLRSAVYKAISRHGDDEAFEALFAIYRSTELSEEKNRIVGALGPTTVGDRLNKVAQFVLTDEVRIQDKNRLLVPMAISHPQFAWKFFQDNKDTIRNNFGPGNMMRQLVKYTTENFSSETKAAEIEDFFAKNQFPGTEKTVQQSIETIRVNANWLERDGDRTKEFLLKS